MYNQINPTIKDASRLYRTLANSNEVSALLGEEYKGLEWSATSRLASARRAALEQGIAPDQWGIQDFIEPLAEAAAHASFDIHQAALVWQ